MSFWYLRITWTWAWKQGAAAYGAPQTSHIIARDTTPELSPITTTWHGSKDGVDIQQGHTMVCKPKYTHTHTHTHSLSHTQTIVHTSTHRHRHTHTHTQSHTNDRAHKYTHTHTHTNDRAHQYTHTLYTHTHTNDRAHTHTHTETYTQYNGDSCFSHQPHLFRALAIRLWQNTGLGFGLFSGFDMLCFLFFRSHQILELTHLTCWDARLVCVAYLYKIILGC